MKNKILVRRKEPRTPSNRIPIWVGFLIFFSILSGYLFNSWFAEYVFDQKLKITPDAIGCLSVIFGFVVLALGACLGSYFEDHFDFSKKWRN